MDQRKLPPDDILRPMLQQRTYRSIAAEFGVSTQHVAYVAARLGVRKRVGGPHRRLPVDPTIVRLIMAIPKRLLQKLDARAAACYRDRVGQICAMLETLPDVPDNTDDEKSSAP